MNTPLAAVASAESDRGLRKVSLCAVAVGLGLLAGASHALAQATLSAANVSAAPGHTAAVAITMSVESANVAFFGVTFTVVPQHAAPVVVGKLTYQAATPPGAPLTVNNATGSLAIGYLLDITPPLTGTLVIGTLMVPIPGSAIGSYQVQLSKLSAGDSLGNQVRLLGQTGTISVLAPATCDGDCDGNGQVTIDEVLTMVNIALGSDTVSECLAGDTDGSGTITIDEILSAVHDALNGCPGLPTPSPTATPTVSLEAAATIPPAPAHRP